MKTLESQRTSGEAPRGTRFVLGVLVFGVVATAAYWVVWFGVDREILASAHTASYYTFENAFPLADAWMTFTGLAATVALVRRRASALLWCIAAGTNSVYLGLLDVLFDLENGIYRSSDAGAVTVEVVINVLTLSMGAFVLGWTWARRRELARFGGF
jgi:nicotinamide riboside transporter PnuC